MYDVVDMKCYNDNQKIAMTSYMYNTWWYQMNLRRYIKQCRYKDIKYIMSVWGWNQKYPWLIKRRQAEIKLFNK